MWLQWLLLLHEHGVGILLLWPVHQLAHDVNGDREYDGAVVLGRYAVQCLKISELKREDGTHFLGLAPRINQQKAPAGLRDCPQ